MRCQDRVIFGLGELTMDRDAERLACRAALSDDSPPCKQGLLEGPCTALVAPGCLTMPVYFPKLSKPLSNKHSVAIDIDVLLVII